MPELPEVETVRSMLSPQVVGRRIREIILHRPDFVKSGGKWLPRLAGSECLRLWRHGKFLWLDTASGVTALMHLGMTGYLGMAEPRDPLAKHTHVVWRFLEGSDELRHVDPRRFGRLAFYETDRLKEASPLERLGVDALAMRRATFRKILQSRNRRLKGLLLDQSVIAGLGNIYIDEALYAARLHPETSSGLLDDDRCDRLWKEVKRVLRASIRAGGSSIDDYRKPDGQTGWYQVRLRVYGRGGEPCARCGMIVTTRTISGRTTHFCPACQVPNTST